MDAHSLQGYPLQYITGTHLCTWQRETRNNVTETEVPCLKKQQYDRTRPQLFESVDGAIH